MIKVNEEAPVNSVGGGHIAGVGIGPQGEPPMGGKVLRRKKKFKEFMNARPRS